MTTLNIPIIVAAPEGDPSASKAEDIAIAFNALRAAYLSYTNIGWSIVDSFEAGRTVTIRNELLRWAATGQLYRWDGGLPKIVAPGSSPATAGGLGSGAWVQVNLNGDSVRDGALRKATLDLDFANGRYKVYSNKRRNELPLQDAISTSRSSTATANHPFGVVTYDINEPRIEYDPLTGSPLGLLSEEQRTNLVTFSQEFDNAVWTKRGGSTITPNTTIAPDGTLTADTHTNTDTVQNGSYIRYIGAFATDNTVYTCSFFTKRGSRSECRLVMYSRLGLASNATIVYNFDTDVVSIVNSGSVTGVTAGVIKYPNGWIRLWASFNCLAGSEVAGFNIIPSNWAIPASIGSEFGYVWGAQVEVGNFLTNYIPTGPQTFSRVFDNNQVPNVPVDLAKLSEYTIIAEYTVIDASKGVLFGVADSFDNTVYATVNTPGFFRAGGNGGPSCQTAPVVAGTRYKHAIKVKSGDYAVARNGIMLLTSIAVFPIPVNPTRVKAGSAPWETTSGTGNQSTVIFHRFTIIPRGLSTAELQATTA